MTRPHDAPPEWRDTWRLHSRTTNTALYADGPLLIAWPDAGTIDTGERARENAEAELAYLRELGRPGVLVIFIDRISHQDSDARKTYASMGGEDLVSGIALVGGTMMSRAIGSFFLGLSKLKSPTRIFSSYADAEPWVKELIAER